MIPEAIFVDVNGKCIQFFFMNSVRFTWPCIKKASPHLKTTLSATKSGKKIISLVSFQRFQMVNICHCPVCQSPPPVLA